MFFMQQILLNSEVGWRIDEDYMVMRINKCIELVKVKKTDKMANGKNLLKLEENRIVLPWHSDDDIIDSHLSRVLDSIMRVKNGMEPLAEQDVMFLMIKKCWMEE